MFTHKQIWEAIDRLAQSSGYSTSGLAKLAGLDPTSFNKSKRLSPEGKPRWPSTESLAKILTVTNLGMTEFITYIETTSLPASKKLSDSGQLVIDTDRLKPFYRRGDIIGIDAKSPIKPSDRIVIQFKNGDLMIADYIGHSASDLYVEDFFDQAAQRKTIPLGRIAQFARIQWVKHP